VGREAHGETREIIRPSVDGEIAEAIVQRGWSVVESFLAPDVVAALRDDACMRLQAGEFHRAGIGAGARHAMRTEVRSDLVLWLEEPGATEAQRNCLARFEALRTALNRELQLGLVDFECHYACYPAGACYGRHLDRLAGDDRRVLSCVLYLNERWAADDGGELRLYPEGGVQQVLPQGGSLVAFLSESFEHEVLPAGRERWSLTGWFRRRGRAAL
jgi:SM-20-related protein